MSNKEVMDLVITTAAETSSLISLWGLANYFKHKYFRLNLFGIEIELDLEGYSYSLALTATYFIMGKNICRTTYTRFNK